MIKLKPRMQVWHAGLGVIRGYRDAQRAVQTRTMLSELPTLPPLHGPHRSKHTQAAGGTALVLGIIVVCVGSTLASTLAAPVSDAAAFTLIGLVGLAAVVALICLAGLLFGDPGVVRRTPDSTLPVPTEVTAALDAGKTPSDAGLRNLGGEDGKSYCVRCCVWRIAPPLAEGTTCLGVRCEPKQAGSFHHCSVCQRCVSDFDHHCGVFGRCIAGKGRRGNMKYFLAIIAAGQIGVAVACAAVSTGLVYRWGPVALAPLLGALCCVAPVTRGWFGFFRCPRLPLTRRLQQGVSALRSNLEFEC